MITYCVEWNPLATEDLRSIHAYIETELFAPNSAQKVIQRIYDKANTLSRFPERCPKDEEVPVYRYLIEGNHIIYFLIRDETRVVEIVWIRSKRQERITSKREGSI